MSHKDNSMSLGLSNAVYIYLDCELFHLYSQNVVLTVSFKFKDQVHGKLIIKSLHKSCEKISSSFLCEWKYFALKPSHEKEQNDDDKLQADCKSE